MTHHDHHHVPALGCPTEPCRGWTARMLADDDRDLDELVTTVERAATTTTLRHQAETLADPALDADAYRLARLLSAATTLLLAARTAADRLTAERAELAATETTTPTLGTADPIYPQEWADDAHHDHQEPTP